MKNVYKEEITQKKLQAFEGRQKMGDLIMQYCFSPIKAQWKISEGFREKVIPEGGYKPGP